MNTKSFLKLLGKYSKEEHLRLMKGTLNIDYSKLSSIKPIFSERWKNQNVVVPYIAESHIIDSYYSLPERPDIAFTCLWKAINNSYNNYFLKQANNNLSCKKLSDTKSLEKVVEHISNDSNKSFNYNSVNYTIEELVNIYINKIPDKTYSFVSNYILKGMAVTGPNVSGVSDIYASSSYKTFKSKFASIHDVIEKTYGEKYRNICNVSLSSDKTYVNFGINDSNKIKSRKLVHNLSISLRDMLEGNICKLDNKDSKYSGEIKLLSFHERLSFLVFVILYAVRNNNTHGNVVSRMNSAYTNSDSFKAAEYIFLLAHMFLSLIMYKNGDLHLDELGFNVVNIQ
ncbi:hypothetical protein [Aeromonas hydrophila]|uniref:hypothetical protein n=1 Tax=Aeromonas hydrophila TaxID=644 RepID=UPI0021694FDE|nr:hypothetical protein [Aeromonas hydrophila]MCS3793790.1 hypothetical protein [Aeromonas hydrophila]